MELQEKRALGRQRKEAKTSSPLMAGIRAAMLPNYTRKMAHLLRKLGLGTSEKQWGQLALLTAKRGSPRCRELREK